MMKGLVLTNNKYRKLLYWDDLTEVEKEAFDYEEGETFIRYNDYVYLIPDDFISAKGLSVARKRKWDLIEDTGNSGYMYDLVTIKYNYHKTAVRVGRYYE
jgi:hypothetical protein